MNKPKNFKKFVERYNFSIKYYLTNLSMTCSSFTYFQIRWIF